MAERALEMMCARAANRKAFGKSLLRHVSTMAAGYIHHGYIHHGNSVYCIFTMATGIFTMATVIHHLVNYTVFIIGMAMA